MLFGRPLYCLIHSDDSVTWTADGNVVLTAARSPGWYSFGLVLNTDMTWEGYVNGTLAASGSDPASYEWFAQNRGFWLNLFADGYSTTSLYGGNVDTLLVYARALDPEQVAWLHGNT